MTAPVARPLSPDTWRDFARLATRGDGVWGGCGFLEFHPEGAHEVSFAVTPRSRSCTTAVLVPHWPTTAKTVSAVIHNVVVWSAPAVMPVNVVAPYLLTALLPLPRRLIYLSSGSRFAGHPSLGGGDGTGRSSGSYCDSMLFVTTLATAIARLHPEVLSNAVYPAGYHHEWVDQIHPTTSNSATQPKEWLAVSDEPQATTSGGYWHHWQRLQPHRAATDRTFQESLLQTLAAETGTAP